MISKHRWILESCVQKKTTPRQLEKKEEGKIGKGGEKEGKRGRKWKGERKRGTKEGSWNVLILAITIAGRFQGTVESRSDGNDT